MHEKAVVIEQPGMPERLTPVDTAQAHGDLALRQLLGRAVLPP